MLQHYIISTLTVLVIYLILDGVWLGVIAKESYQSALQGMLREHYPITPWVAFYVIYAFAIAHLVIIPNLNAASVLPVLFSGFILGLAAYGAYNLTNYAILKGWPLSISVKDLMWGSIAGSSGSALAWYATRFLISKF